MDDEGSKARLPTNLFTLLLADMKEMFGNGGWGGVKIEGRKIYMLAYADDMVMFAEDED